MKNPAASFGRTGVPCRISVTYRPIQELKPDPTNPRRSRSFDDLAREAEVANAA